MLNLSDVKLEAWRLVHEVHLPMRRVSLALGLPVSRVFELLAEEKVRRERAALRGGSGSSNQESVTSSQPGVPILALDKQCAANNDPSVRQRTRRSYGHRTG